MRDRNVVLDRLSSSLWARRSSYCSASAAQPGRAAEAEQIISIVLTAGHIQLHSLAVLCPKDDLERLRSVPRTVFLPDGNVFLPVLQRVRKQHNILPELLERHTEQALHISCRTDRQQVVLTHDKAYVIALSIHVV